MSTGQFNPDSLIRVVAVCGSVATVYSELKKGEDRRERLFSKEFPHRGAAALWAQEYEQAERGAQIKRGAA